MQANIALTVSNIQEESTENFSKYWQRELKHEANLFARMGSRYFHYFCQFSLPIFLAVLAGCCPIKG